MTWKRRGTRPLDLGVTVLAGWNRVEEGEEEDTSLTTVDVARLTRQALGKFMEASVFLAQACV